MTKFPAVTPQERWIESARKFLRPSEVRLHHVPNWLRQRIIGTIGASYYGTGGHSVFEYACEKSDSRYAFDHWGSTVWGDRSVFVSEPYLSMRHVDAAERFADLFDLHLLFDANSWWYPGHTTRLIFLPMDPKEGPSTGSVSEKR